MINFLEDIYSYFKLKQKETNYRIGFFCENNYIYEYLEPYIEKKKVREKILIISFQKISKNEIDKSSLFVFHTNFFRELVFLTLRLKFLYSSTPDLNKTIFKKSKFSNCKYIYLHHTPVSLTLIYNKNAFDSFDAIQIINKFQLKEIKEISKKNNINIKKFKSKYLFINKQIDNNKKQVAETDLLIAPSWNSSFYKLNCHVLLSEYLKKSTLTYKLRPHPMSYKKNEITKSEIEKLNIQIDNETFLDLSKYKFLITDWSGIFIEFALTFKRKSFLINTPKKIVNKNYLNYENEPIEISLRNILGKTYEIKSIQNIIEEIKVLKNNLESMKYLPEDEGVKKIINQNFY